MAATPGQRPDLDCDQQQLAKQIFQRLIAPGEGTEDTKRRVPRAEFDDTDRSAPEVLDTLASTRLVTLDTETVEITHEALLGSRGISYPCGSCWLSLCTPSAV